MEPSFYLHSYLIFEILLRTSSDALGRGRLASKEWNKMSYDSKFKIVRSQKINVVDGFLVVEERFGEEYIISFASFNDETHQIFLNFVPGFDVRVLAVSVNSGIILCTSYNLRQYRAPCLFVCKPQVKLARQIPNPRTRFYTQGVAVSVVCSNPFRYKILRISSPKAFVKNCQLILEVFDSGAWQWKRLKDILLSYRVSFSGLAFRERTVVEACGAFHWLLYVGLIFSFDIEKEEWKITGLPVVEDDYRHIKMAKYEGKLALMCTDRDGYMQTWVLESYVNMVWKERFVTNIKVPGSTYFTYRPLAFHGSDIIVMSGLWSLKYYDFNNENFLKESKLKILCSPRHGDIFPFWSDSEPCCLRQGRVNVGAEE